MDSLIIYVISDSVGETAQQVTKAALSQFNMYNDEFYIPNPPDERVDGLFYQQEVDLSHGASQPTTPFEVISKQHMENEINNQLFNDLLFRDVIVYENDPNGRMGLDKCYDNKTGYCVEYGQTGIAYYYPDIMPYDYYGAVVNESLTLDERRQPITGSVSYPNLR